MVARARSRDFDIFMRKVGWSVGLEHTLDRLADFATLYASHDTLSLGMIKRLLHDPKPAGWGLEAKNEHILDFFRTLNVVSVRGADVGVLELGEALGITRILLDNAEFSKALPYLFLYEIILADGDIFLNALASEFEDVAFAASLARLIEHKWSLLEGVFKTSEQRGAIYRSISIEMQESNPGSRGKQDGRSGPLVPTSTASSGPLNSDAGRPEIRMSAHYIANTLGRRKAWALSLGLCNPQGRLTERGRHLLYEMTEAGFAGPSCMATWPLKHELQTPLFVYTKLPDSVPNMSSWQFMRLVGFAGGFHGKPEKQGGETDILQLINTIKAFFSLNKSKSIVRNELPVRVAYRCLLATYVGSAYVPNIPSLIEEEQMRKSPRIVSRPSRIAESALSLARLG